MKANKSTNSNITNDVPVSIKENFIQMYGGLKSDNLDSIKQTSDGGYITCGATHGDGDFPTTKGHTDALIIKLDRNGNIQWSKIFGGSSSDSLQSIQETKDGGYITCGYTCGDGDFPTSKGSYDALIMKLDSSGDIQWLKMYGGSSSEGLYSIQETSDGKYIACGHTWGGGDFNNSNGESDCIIINII